MNSSRKPLISGNWKMNLNHFEAIQHVQKLSYALDRRDHDAADIAVHPPFTDLRSVQTLIDADKLSIQLGAQQCHWEEKGAFTGEVSPAMLAKLKVRYVIVGHSERRELFDEDDEMANKKVKAVMAQGMTPILCVGETLDEREQGATETKVDGQVRKGLEGVPQDQVGAMVIAYEPIWAIGTGRTATPDDAQEVCALIRRIVGEMCSEGAAGSLRVQYGGSVKDSNAAELLEQPDVDGLLVGGASLDPDGFARIAQATRSG